MSDSLFARPEAPPGPSPQRAEFELAVLRAVAGLVPGCLPARVRATLEVEGEGVVLRVVIPPERTLAAAAWSAPAPAPSDAPPVAPAAAAADAPRAGPLRQVHRRLLAAATGRPVPAKVLVKLAGYAYSARSREAVTQLCRWGLLVRTPDGLIPGRPPP